MKWITCAILALALSGCTGTKTGTVPVPATPVHQGAANAFASTSYDALVTAKAAIQKAHDVLDLTNPTIKAIYVKAATVWDVASAAWKVYNAAALAGTATAADQATLQTQMDQMNTAVVALGSTK